MDGKYNTNRKEYATNPRKKASLISRLGFCWILPLIKKGYNRDLDEDDLFEPLEKHMSCSLGDKLEKAWQKECDKNKQNPSLWTALIRVFGLEFGRFGLILLFLEGSKMSQLIFLSHLLGYFRAGQTDISRNEAITYAALISASSLFNVLGSHTYMFGLQQIGMNIRIACCSLIYRKSLRLSNKAMRDTTIGQMVNLTSNDVNRFDSFVINFHNIWCVPLEICAISFLLVHYVGFTPVVGIGFLVLYLPMQMYLGKRFSILRLQTALRTDERVRLMNEIINGIQVIKMYTWEKSFSKLIDIARRIEIKYIRKTSYVNGILFSLGIFSTRFTLFLTLLTHVLLGNKITPEYVFVTYSFFHMLRQCLTIFFPQGIAQFSETKISVARIKTFLLYDEIQQRNDSIICGETKEYKDIKNGPHASAVPYRLRITNAVAKWCTDTADDALKNINIEAKSQDLIAIIGSVGAGKSSLLQIILKELPLLEGNVDYYGTISYASQEGWLFGATVRQNILFGEEYNKTKYKEVIRACALERDLKLFPYGDKSLVGERGIMVSGGQKARINLARAIYKDADIYLLDDPLSAVDTRVGKRLFVECIQNYLKEKCVILVTHQLQYLKNLNNIILMDKGEIKGRGNYKQIEELDFDFTKIMKSDNVEEDEAEVRKLKTLESIHEQYNEQQELQETRHSGSIEGSVYTTYVKSMGNLFCTTIIWSLFLFAQIAASGSDYYLSYWLNSERAALQNFENNTSIDDNIFLIQRNTHMYIYTAIIISLVILALFRSTGFFLLSMRASIKLHNKMFEAIVYSPLRFFHENSSGRILNRFSKDVGSLDQTLPTVLSDTVAIGLNVVGISLLIGIINPWFFLVTCIILILFYFMRVVYLKTSRDVKRLETTTRSPVFTHISASLQGLTTIRAFNAQVILIKEFDDFQDAHTSAWYMFLSSSRIFGYWMDLVCVIYVAMVTLSFVLIDNLNSGENVGLAITQSLTLTGMFQWGMRQWSELENQMTSVERVVEYTKLKREGEQIKPSTIKVWPTMGQIEFKNLSMKYTAKGQYILRDLNFVIEPQEKIGVVGRTGAGKTSLISALFQLTETEGEILIDGISVSNLLLDVLRSNIAIIPQEPVLFSGTMRKNLDPFEKYQDVELWNVLEEVELKKLIAELPNGLNTKMLEGGTNFSVGQRQLVCLARAIIRKNKILVLDEATANVDPQTDYLIQQTIRRKFAACTVITIAHRLNTIMDSDKVLVMAAGRFIEYDHPYSLLQIKNSAFAAMVNQTGKNMADNLKKIAEKSFNTRTTSQYQE